MSDEARPDIEVVERPETAAPDCGCNAERERRVAAFLIERLKDVKGVARIYSTREGGSIDFTVEVADFWRADVRREVYDVFRRLRRTTLSDGVDFMLYQVNTMPRPGGSSTVWLG